MEQPKPCPFCGCALFAREFGDQIRTTVGGEHPTNGCVLDGYLFEDIPAWNKRAEWTVTREDVRSALMAGDKAVDGSPPGVAMMKGGVAIVEAFGGKVVDL